MKSLNLDKDRREAILNTLMCFEAHTKIPDIPDDTPLGGIIIKTRPSVMEVSPQTFRLSKSILLIDHRIPGDHRIAGDHRIPGDHQISAAGIIE